MYQFLNAGPIWSVILLIVDSFRMWASGLPEASENTSMVIKQDMPRITPDMFIGQDLVKALAFQ